MTNNNPKFEAVQPQSTMTRSVRNRQEHDEDVAYALLAASQELRPRYFGQIENEQDQLRPHWLPLGIPAGAEQVVQPGLSVADDPEWIRKPRPLRRARRPAEFTKLRARLTEAKETFRALLFTVRGADLCNPP